MKKITQLQQAIEARAHQMARCASLKKADEIADILDVGGSFQINVDTDNKGRVWAHNLVHQIRGALEKELFEQMLQQEIKKLIDPIPNIERRRHA